MFALVVVIAGGALLPSVRVGTRQWDAAPMFFVSVRGELDEPVVLREIRRVTDHLREQPGVANAWSVADLFMGVTLEGDEASRIPDDPEQVRRILVQARTDPAVRLELAGDHREALIAVRFDDDPTVDHLTIVARLERYLELELRRALLRVDTSAPGVSPVTRSLGRGVLAIDARERVLRICARSGRPLDATEALAVERVARQAATIPAADPARLEADIADNVRDFIARHPFALGPAETSRLIAAVAAMGDGASVDEVRVAVATAYGGRLSDTVLRTTADSLARRIAAVRRRHIAATNFKDMLTGAQLPSEGVLADEVRGATLDAMGPVVGIPAPADSPTAFRLDLVPVGGAPNDRALSLLWRKALGAGAVAAAGLLAILLVFAGGPAGVLSLPLALAPAAAAIAPAALLGEPVGLPTLSFYGGALAAGALLALAVDAAPPGVRRSEGRMNGRRVARPRVGLLPPSVAARRRGSSANRSTDGRRFRRTKRSFRPRSARDGGAEKERPRATRAGDIGVAEARRRRRAVGRRRARLADLLTARATEFHALGRAIPESVDLETVARLDPTRGAKLGPARAVAAAAAGDAWKAIGARTRRRRRTCVRRPRRDPAGDVGMSRGAAGAGGRRASRPPTSTATCSPARRCRRGWCRWLPPSRGCSTSRRGRCSGRSCCSPRTRPRPTCWSWSR